MTRKILVLALLLAPLLSAHAAEHLLAPPAFEPMMAYYSGPAIATDGSSFLAAWVATPYDRTPMLMVQRLDATAPPLAIVTDAKLAFGGADLVWSNGSYLLIWNRDFELHATRLDRDGHSLADRVLATDLRNPIVATDGTTTVVVARTDFGKEGIVALTLDGADHVVGRRTIWSSAEARYDVVARSGGFTVALAASPDGVYTMRLDARGDPVDAAPRLMAAAPNGYNPDTVALASRGSDTLLVWTMTSSFEPSEFFAALLSASGELGTTAALPHSGASVGIFDVVDEGDGYSVVASSGTRLGRNPTARHLEAVRLRADGSVASGPLRVTSDNDSIEWFCRVARSSSGYAVVAISSTDASVTTSERITAVTTPLLGSAAAPVVLSRAATSQYGPAIASDGAGYLAAWLERSLTRDQIIAAPLDRNGAPAAPPVTLFDRGFSYTSTPKVVFGGGVYLVTWEVDGAAWGVRFDAGGRPLDAERLNLSGAIGADAPQFDVTATPAGFFIVWTRLGTIYGAALTGALPAPPQKLAEPKDKASNSDPHVAFNGSAFLLSYGMTPPCVATPCQAYTTWQMIRLDSAARPLDVAPHALDGPITVASDGRDFAIVQFGRVLRIDAQTLATTARIDLDSALQWPALVWTGSHYILVTLDVQADGGGRAIAREITTAWTFGGARTTTIEPRVSAFAAAANAAGDVIAAYARRLAETPFQGAPRAAVKAIDDVPPVRGRAARHP